MRYRGVRGVEEKELDEGEQDEHKKKGRRLLLQNQYILIT